MYTCLHCCRTCYHYTVTHTFVAMKFQTLFNIDKHKNTHAQKIEYDIHYINLHQIILIGISVFLKFGSVYHMRVL